jgi:tripartite-type tricarboxylate transporter receptor subunit TctC
MKITRRAIALGCLLAIGTSAFAQSFPQRPIKLIVPFPAGGGTDNLARLIATKLTDSFQWTVVVENKPGAGGNVALDTTAKAPADGYTLVMAQTDNVVLNPLLYSKLTYDPVKDLQPVALVASGPAVLVVRADSPYKTLADIVAAAKAKPGELTFASPGTGTIAHLISEAWQKSSGIKLTHVPFRGMSQALPDLIGGRLDMYMGSIPTLQSQLQGGKVRAIAVTTAKRSPVLPEVPTYTESGIRGVELASVWGVMAPAGTPAAIVNQINAAVNKVVQIPETTDKIVSSGAAVLSGTPQQMADLYTADRARLALIVRDSGTKLD